MLKKVILFVILSCLGANLFAQQNNEVWKRWFNNHPGVRFLAAALCFNNILIAGGEGSTLYEVTSGKVWCNLGLGPEIDIVSLAYDQINNDVLVLCRDNFTQESYLYSVSALKTIIRLATFFQSLYFVKIITNTAFLGGNEQVKSSTDGGKQLTDHNVPDLENINDMVSGGSASAVGDILFGKSKLGNDNGIRTTKDFMNYDTPSFAYYLAVQFDGAEQYHPVPSLGKAKSLSIQSSPIFAYGLQTATYQYVVCRSTDDGASWDSVFAAPQNQGIRSLSAGSNNNVIVGVTDYGGGSGEELYYTKNGGDTWAKGKDSINKYIYSITHVSADTAYALGEKGLIVLTTDGGENWTQISDNHPGVSTVFFPSPSIGYAAGISGPFPSHVLNVYKTTDAGDDWRVTYVDSTFSPSSAFLNSIFFVDDMNGFIAGSKFIKTTDGGISWNEVNSGVSSSDPSFPDPNFNDVYFVNNNLGFAVYRDFSTGDGVIKTTDGGTMWSPLNINNDKYDKRYIYFVDENLGFVSGTSTLYRTTDGGDSWDTLAVGYNNEHINSKVNFINSTTGFFGKKGQVFKTTDRGDTWTDAPIENHTIPTQIQFVSDSIGYFVSDTDTFGIHTHVLYKTTDGGNSWLDLTNELPTIGISSMFFTDENTGYLAGNLGILKTTSGGETITSVNEFDNAFIPGNFKLYQNYPNPFNPTTKIEYSIPYVGTSRDLPVRLIVYDVLGRKVKTLVNKQQQPGNYEVHFNGSKLASGVYFYRLKAGSFSNTKKLVLLK